MPRKKGESTLGADPLAVYLDEGPAEAPKPTPAAKERRPLNVRIPSDLWQRLDAFYQGQPRSVTKDALLAEALDAYLTAKGA